MNTYTKNLIPAEKFFGIALDLYAPAGRVENENARILYESGRFLLPFSQPLAIDERGFLRLGRGNRTGCKNYGHYRAQGDNGGQGLEPCRAG